MKANCPICLEPTAKRNMVSDHDHKTGMSRGTICRACNAGLGMFKDNQASLLKAVEYLQQYALYPSQVEWLRASYRKGFSLS